MCQPEAVVVSDSPVTSQENTEESGRVWDSGSGGSLDSPQTFSGVGESPEDRLFTYTSTPGTRRPVPLPRTPGTHPVSVPGQ